MGRWPALSWKPPSLWETEEKKPIGVGDSNLIARLSIPPERFLMRQNLKEKQHERNRMRVLQKQFHVSSCKYEASM